MEESGLQFVTAYEAFTKEPPSKNSERIYVIAREQGKVPVKKQNRIIIIEETGEIR